MYLSKCFSKCPLNAVLRLHARLLTLFFLSFSMTGRDSMLFKKDAYMRACMQSTAFRASQRNTPSEKAKGPLLPLLPYSIRSFLFP